MTSTRIYLDPDYIKPLTADDMVELSLQVAFILDPDHTIDKHDSMELVLHFILRHAYTTNMEHWNDLEARLEEAGASSDAITEAFNDFWGEAKLKASALFDKLYFSPVERVAEYASLIGLA